MVHRLSAQGLLAHIRYQGVDLTEQGSHQAAAVVRSHRLWERFLVDCLGLSWAAVHEVACRLEHATDPEVADALDAFLGYPATCPHGNPVPDAQGAIRAASDCSLAALLPGETAAVVRIHPESDSLLAYLDSQELRPGATFVVQEIMLFGGPIVLRVGDTVRYVGQEAAAQLFVRREAAA
jgi:DtxR family Mn-dependent transcriptional regulator